jgi:putative ABC transport system permease protein
MKPMSLLRSVLREPRTSLPAILMLAFGIGAFTWMLALHRSLMLRSLEVPEAGQLVSLWNGSLSQPDSHGTPSPMELQAMRGYPQVFEGVAAYAPWTVSLDLDTPQRFKLDSVTPDFFEVLRVQPALGGGFRAEDAVPGAPRAILLTHGAWTRIFGADPAALGREVRLDGVPYRIAGILPRTFQTPHGTEGFTPFQWTAARAQGGGNFLRVVARLRSGASLAQARSAMATLTEDLKARWRAEGAPEEDLRELTYGATPLAQDQLGKGFQVLRILAVGTALVLLLAILNASGILLARGLSRRRDLAVHAALGAEPGQLRRLVVQEGLLLGLLGAALGVGLAVAGLAGATAALAWSFPDLNLKGVRLDGVVVAWTALLGPLVGGGCALGALPRLDLAEALKARGRGLRGTGGRTRRWLVAGQLALATALLGATFAVHVGLDHLLRLDVGYEGGGAWSFEFNPPATKDFPALAERLERLRLRLAELPGVQAAGLTNNVPMTGFRSDLAFSAPSGERLDPQARSASPGALEALGLRVLRGRTFTPQDGAQAPKVMVLNRSLARLAFGSEDPVGRTLNLGTPFTVVGVVEDHREFGPGQPPPPTYWVPLPQADFLWNVQLHAVLRTGPVAPARRELETALKEALPGVAMHRLVPLTDRLHEALGPQRMVQAFLLVFSGLALLLGGGGVFGLMAASVAERRSELAVRTALGAEPLGLLALVLREATLLATGAGIVGGLGALLLERSGRPLLGPWPDPGLAAPALALGALVLAALLAALGPALRAATTPPAEALRSE